MRRVSCVIFLSIFCFIISNSVNAQIIVSGVVQDATTGERLAGAHVYDSDTFIGTTTNADGRYEFQLPEGNHNLVVSFIGYKSVKRMMYAVGEKIVKMDVIGLKPVVYEMKDIVITEYKNPEKLIKLARNHYINVGSDLHYESDQFYRWITSHDSIPVHWSEAVYTMNENGNKNLWKLREGRMVSNDKVRYLPRVFYIDLIDILRNFNVFGKMLNVPAPISESWKYVYDYKILRRSYLDSLEVYQISFIPKNGKMNLFRGSFYIETGTFNVVAADIYIPEFHNPYVVRYDKTAIHKGKFKFKNTSLWYHFRAAPVTVNREKNEVYWLPVTSDVIILSDFEAKLRFTKEQMAEQNLDKSNYHIHTQLITRCHSTSYRYRFSDFQINKKNANKNSDFISELEKKVYHPDYWVNMYRFGVKKVDEKTVKYFKIGGKVKFSTK